VTRVERLLADYGSYHRTRGNIGWGFQAAGHVRFEKNSPAFFRNLVHLLVGPLFLMHELRNARGASPAHGGPK
jgi:uncharacterized membrane protein YGL010W